jgi:rhodanese-related sulfurtransferase
LYFGEEMVLKFINSILPSAMEEVDVTQAHKLNVAGTVLLDVREPNEYEEIHAQNTRHIPLGQLSSRFHEITLDKNQSIAVICRSGVRSATAVQILQEAGFNKVCNIKGGTLAWVQAGLPVVRK